MLYVHVSETNKPWIDEVATEEKEGFEAKPALLDSQISALINFPTKCWVDNNGAVITPDSLPLSDAEQKYQQNDLTIKNLQEQVTQLVSQVNQANADKQSLQNQITVLTQQISSLQASQKAQEEAAQQPQATQETK